MSLTFQHERIAAVKAYWDLPCGESPASAQILLDKRMAYRHTPNMKRTTIWLTEPQVKKLAAASKKTGIAVAELIRRYIDAGLEKA